MTSFLTLCAFLFFWFEQNNYFGWHAHPKSDAELIADGITVVLFSLWAFSLGMRE